MKKLTIIILLALAPFALATADQTTCDQCKAKAGANSGLQFIGNYRNESFAGRKDLQNAVFDGDFSGADFSGADLTGASIRGAAVKAKFIKANMRRFTFHNVNAAGSKFKWANLSGAIMDGNFSHADLRAANMDAVNGKNSNFNYAALDYASMNKFYGASSSFYKARFFRTDVINSVFYNVNMAFSDVTRAVFVDNDLRKTNQYQIKWNRAQLVRGNDVTGVFYYAGKPPQ